nr:hypothetical protein [Rhodomicrobium vannielii]
MGKRVTIKLPAETPDAADLLVSAKLGGEVTFSLRTRDPALVKQRHAAAMVQIEKQFAALREGPKPLTKKMREAIAGLLYTARLLGRGRASPIYAKSLSSALTHSEGAD